MFSTSPTRPGEFLAVRFTWEEPSTKNAPAKASDAATLLGIFGLKRESIQLPIAFFLWGEMPVSAFHISEELSPEHFRWRVKSVQEGMRKSWAERGWDASAADSVANLEAHD